MTELDKEFDDNTKDVIQHFDIKTAVRINKQQKKINIDMPIWLINTLDFKAKELGISRQAVIKTWLAEKAKEDNRT